tara:strand:+ start:329 stop:586 length:258 start_codon:yes stop_codon:yes gene_type:complete
MAGIRDREFMAAAARLASCLNLSAATARQRIDYQAVKEGIRDNAGKVALAQRMLEEAQCQSQAQGERLDEQLQALESEAYFLTED